MAKEFRQPDVVNLYGRIRKMSFRQFASWINAYGFECFTEGLREGEEEGAWWDEDQLFDLLRSEKIGGDRANRIIDRMLDGPMGYTEEKGA